MLKLNGAKENDDLIFDEEEDFNAEDFFGIKEENLAINGSMGINEDLMMKAI